MKLKVLEVELRYRLKGYERVERFLGEALPFWVLLSQKTENGETVLSLELAPVEPIELIFCRLELAWSYYPSDRLMVNGFQSWTQSREYAPTEKLPPLRNFLRNLSLPYGDYAFFKQTPENGFFHSHEWTYIRHKNEDEKLVLGSLDTSGGYTIFQHDFYANKLQIFKDCEGKTITQDTRLLTVWAAEKQPDLDRYFQRMGVQPRKAQPCLGWTSWYHYYTNISPAVLTENLENFAQKKCPIDVFQIDDGWQAAVGDWLTTNKKFPGQMKTLAAEIQAKGFKAGLWIAPFVCEAKSKIFQEHKDWLLKDPQTGQPLRAGFNPDWSGWARPFFYALNPLLPQVQEYVRSVFHLALNEWGFDLLKLDFLYAAALLPQNGKCRAEIMTETMDFLRQCAGDKQLLGCGVPLAAAYGRVEYCRIGPDVGLGWDFDVLRWLNNRERISTVNSIGNALSRSYLNGRVFQNDPDVFILRKEKNRLTPAQQFTLFLANQIGGGLVFTSDNLKTYSNETQALYNQQFPLLERKILSVRCEGETYFVRFLIDDLEYLAHFNLSAKEQIFALPDGDFFDGRSQIFLSGQTKTVLQPFESRCYLKLLSGQKRLGSDRMLFPASEIVPKSMENGETIWSKRENCMGEVTVYFEYASVDEVPVALSGGQFRQIGGRKVWAARF